MRILTRKERQEIRGLVRQCANYDRADKMCLLMDAAGEAIDCPMLAIKQAGKVCGYFKNAVLPLNPVLATVLTCSEPLTKRLCNVCGQPFIPQNNRQLYCGDKCRKKATLPKAGRAWQTCEIKQDDCYDLGRLLTRRFAIYFSSF